VPQRKKKDRNASIAWNKGIQHRIVRIEASAHSAIREVTDQIQWHAHYLEREESKEEEVINPLKINL
jgi:hypothetical protein